MNAGRELDALVAQKVMGKLCEDIPQGSGRECPLCSPQHYSTDISAAWLVVEKLNSLMFDVWKRHDEGGEYWYAEFRESSFSPDTTACSRTAPESICLAALKAFGVEVEP